ncbi:MAG: hypothetical protein CMJ19_20580 [Phycisphaeraceae bacterium]|nr:hypothetical protein [Phycisphaeraceae bacterium]
MSRKKTKRKIKAPRKPLFPSKSQPSMPLTPLTEALGMMQAGELDMAMELVDQHLAANTDDPFAHHLKGLILHRLERYAEAVTLFARSIELGDPQPAWYINLGISQRSDGDCGAALASFNTALEHDPENQPAHFQLALTYCDIAENHREHGDLEKAKATYETALHHDSSCEEAHEGLSKRIDGMS